SKDAADRSSDEWPIQNVETNVPACSAHGDKAAINAVPQRQARTAIESFELPPGIAVLKQLGSIGSCHSSFGNLRRSHPGELHRSSNRTQVPIGFEGCPLAQMRRIGNRLPDLFRCVTQFSDENERPLLLSVLSYLRSAGRTWHVLLAIAHLLLLASAWNIKVLTTWLPMRQVDLLLVSLLMLLSVETLLDSLFKQSEEPLHVGKRRLRIVVVVHQAMFVLVALSQILVNDETRLLHRGTPVLEFIRDFFGRLFERAI